MLIRISLIVAILAGLAVGALNFTQVKNKVVTLQTNLKNTQDELASTQQTLNTTKSTLAKTESKDPAAPAAPVAGTRGRCRSSRKGHDRRS